MCENLPIQCGINVMALILVCLSASTHRSLCPQPYSLELWPNTPFIYVLIYEKNLVSTLNIWSTGRASDPATDNS